MKVVALAGGTGSSKILRGLSKQPVELTVIGNVGDNCWMHGVYICPDLDIAMYVLAGISDGKRGWGIKEDTFETMSQLSTLGEEAWFRVGDRDLATSLLRTELLREGNSLTEATEKIRHAIGVREVVLPVTDAPVATFIDTPSGPLSLQEFWVREGGRPRVRGAVYRGASMAIPTEKVLEALSAADRVVVCPANPVTSIGPMLAIPGFVECLSGIRARITALSPMVGSRPFSGPAAKLMRAQGIHPSSRGVARMYLSFLDAIIVDRRDASMMGSIKKMGVSCTQSRTKIQGPVDEKRLAKELLEA